MKKKQEEDKFENTETLQRHLDLKDDDSLATSSVSSMDDFADEEEEKNDVIPKEISVRGKWVRTKL